MNILLRVADVDVADPDPEAEFEFELEAGAGEGAGAGVFPAAATLPPWSEAEAGLDDEKKSRSKARGVVPACSRIQLMSAGVEGALRVATSDPLLEKKERDLEFPLCCCLVVVRK